MSKLAANLSTLFREAPFLERFELAAKAGFRHVECQFLYDYSVADIRARLDASGLDLVLFNLPPGDFDAGERGLAIFPNRKAEFRQALDQALDYAAALGCPRLHCMAGIVPPSLDRERLHETYLENLRWAASEGASRGVAILIEPLNALDMPGYHLASVEQAAAIIAEVGAPNLLLQYDFYHRACSIPDPSGLDLVAIFDRHRDIINHVQIAGAPGRHEPNTGDTDFGPILQHLDEVGYDGFVGCEWNPKSSTEAGLHWAKPYLDAA